MNLLIEQHDADGVRAAYVRAAALGTPDAPYALVQLAEPETPAYPPGLPHEFDPANMMRTMSRIFCWCAAEISAKWPTRSWSTA